MPLPSELAPPTLAVSEGTCVLCPVGTFCVLLGSMSMNESWSSQQGIEVHGGHWLHTFPFFCRDFSFFLRIQAVAKEFIICNAGWTVGSVVQLSLISYRIFPKLFLRHFFSVWTIFGSLYWICNGIASVLWFFGFGYEAYEILAAQAGTEPTPSALEDHWITREFPSQTLKFFFFLFFRLPSTSEGDSASYLQRWRCTSYEFPQIFSCWLSLVLFTK